MEGMVIDRGEIEIDWKVFVVGIDVDKSVEHPFVNLTIVFCDPRL